MNRRLVALFILICLFLAACAGPETGASGSAPANSPATLAQVDSQPSTTPVAQSEPLPALLGQGQADGGDPVTSDPDQPLIFALPTPDAVGDPGPLAGREPTALERVVMSVVKVQACQSLGAPQCTASQGSGVVIHPDGLILTALHVLVEDRSDPRSQPYPDFVIAMTDRADSPAQPRYRAALVAYRPDQDVALLRIYREEQSGVYLEPGDRHLITLPLSRTALDPSSASRGLQAMGYPAAENRFEQAPVAGFSYLDSDRVRMQGDILEGYSGGPILLEGSAGYEVIGLVLERIDVRRVGILPAMTLGGLTWRERDLPRAWVTEALLLVQDDNGLPRLQAEVTVNALDLAGVTAALYAVAVDPESGQPWPSAEEPLFLSETFRPNRLLDQLVLTPSRLLLDLALPERLRFDLRLEGVSESRPLGRGEAWLYVEPGELRPTRTPTAPPLAPTVAASPSFTATPIPATATATDTFTPPPPTRTATWTSTATPAPPTATPTPTTPAAGATWQNPADDAVYVYVPAGEFIMGSEGGESDEQPVHTVYLDAYWIMRTEVTNAQYSRCVTAGRCSEPKNNRWNDSAYAQHPVTHVVWDQATGYAEWAGGRLPTEAEWEKAARGTDGRIYPWGDSDVTSDRANSWITGPQDTVEVGKYPAGASPYGAWDMAGNAWEWTADGYASDYYAAAPFRNPTGPTAGDRRVVRGGAWSLDLDSLRAACRSHVDPRDRVDVLGFRLVSSSPLVSDSSLSDQQSKRP